VEEHVLELKLKLFWAETNCHKSSELSFTNAEK